jgi:vacuolar-type H+-ATPase subunit D/Vma8
MQELQLLNDKVDALLKKYTALQSENLRLKEQAGQHLKEIETLHTKLAALEETAMAKQISNSMGGDKEKNAVRKQLDHVIGEIDKILTSLND